MAIAGSEEGQAVCLEGNHPLGSGSGQRTSSFQKVDRLSSDLLGFTGVSQKNFRSICRSIEKQSNLVFKRHAVCDLF